jgi:amino acid adenylation domain-containing protein
MSSEATLTDLLTEIASLNEAQREALKEQLRQEGIDLAVYESRSESEIGTAAPLSYQQRRLWFLAEFERSSAHYNIPLMLRLEGVLNRHSLRRAVLSIIERHHVLRSCCTEQSGDVAQVLLDPASVEITETKLDAVSDLGALHAQGVFREFDLSNDVPVRVTLFEVSETVHYLFVVFHHIACDGWSLGIFLEEFIEFYNSYSAGCTPSLPPLPMQYSDYAYWQRRALTNDRIQSQLAYWQAGLADLPALVEIPTDRPRPANKTFAGGIERLELPLELKRDLNRLSHQQGTTLFMTLLAGFSILCSRYSGESDIAIGTPIANRQQYEHEGLIGFFANTLLARTHVDSSSSFNDLLQLVKGTMFDAYANQDVPFERLVEALRPERSLSHSPFFQIMFALQNFPEVSRQARDLDISVVELGQTVAKYDLSLFVFESTEGLHCQLEYNTSLYDPTTAARFLAHYRNLLQRVVAQPDASIGSHSLLGRLEHRQLLEDWNATRVQYSKEQGLHELVANRVKDQPGRIAIIDSDASVTYGELWDQASRIARSLAIHRIRPGELVAVVLPKRVSQVAAILGVLQVGGAYLPVDVEWPVERHHAVVKAGGCRVVLSAQKYIAESRWSSDLKVIAVDDLPLEVGDSCTLDLPPVPVSNLAYVIFTSGSTGAPKGVMIEHCAAVNTILDINSKMLVSDEDCVLALSSLAFDLSVYDLFGVLAAGGRVVLPCEEALLQPEIWLRLINEHRVTLWNTVPAVFKMLVDCLETRPASRPPLRLALLSGDWLPVELPRKARELMPTMELISLGGATEASIWSNYFPVVDPYVPRRSIPYGKPLGNQRFYILDKDYQPCPIGVTGELYIAGDGLARGYWGAPELTAERFFRPASLTERAYRTGDLGRWLADGNIEFQGRRDGQVKIRGFRIELGEIESCLAKLPGVRACLVLVCEDQQVDRYLTAYVVAGEDITEAPAGDVTASAAPVEHFKRRLREQLRQFLPEYMVPNAFVLLESLPLSKNGKVDRKALPRPNDSSWVRTPFVSPETATEKTLATIWSKTVGISNISASDDFFSIGGHSILATSVLAQVREVFESPVSLRDIFQYPTLREFATLLDSRTAEHDSHVNPRMLVDRGANPIFFVHTALGDPDHYLALANKLEGSWRVFGLHAREWQPSDLRSMTLIELASYHLASLQKIQPTGPYYLAGHSAGGLLAYEMAYQLHRSGQETSFVGIIDTFDLSAQSSGLSVEEDMADGIWAYLVLDHPHIDKEALTALVNAHRRDTRELLDSLRHSGLVPDSCDYAALSMRAEQYCSLKRMAYQYSPPVLKVPIHQFVSSDSLSRYPQLNWDSTTWSQFTVDVIEGDHTTIMAPPRLDILARKLSHRLMGVSELPGGSSTPHQ